MVGAGIRLIVRLGRGRQGGETKSLWNLKLGRARLWIDAGRTGVGKLGYYGSMRRNTCYSLLISLLVLLVSCTRGPTGKTVAKEEVAPAPFPVPIVELTGTGEEMGTSHGKQLGEPIHFLFD